jgi:hypothetical protein
MLTEGGFSVKPEDLYEVFVDFFEPVYDTDGTLACEGHYYFCVEHVNGNYLEIPEHDPKYHTFVELFGIADDIAEIEDHSELPLMIYEKDGE